MYRDTAMLGRYYQVPFIISLSSGILNEHPRVSVNGHAGQSLPGTVYVIIAFWHLNEHPRVPGHGHAGQALPGTVYVIIAFWNLNEHPRVPGHGRAGQLLPGTIHNIIIFWHFKQTSPCIGTRPCWAGTTRYHLIIVF